MPKSFDFLRLVDFQSITPHFFFDGERMLGSRLGGSCQLIFLLALVFAAVAVVADYVNDLGHVLVTEVRDADSFKFDMKKANLDLQFDGVSNDELTYELLFNNQTVAISHEELHTEVNQTIKENKEMLLLINRNSLKADEQHRSIVAKLSYENPLLDVLNSTQPFTSYRQIYNIELPPSFSRGFVFLVERYEYVHQEGYFLPSTRTETAFKITKEHELADIGNSRQRQLLKIGFRVSDKYYKVFRSKKTIQTLLAQLSGAFNFLFLLSYPVFKFSGNRSFEEFMYSKFKSKRDFSVIRRKTIKKMESLNLPLRNVDRRNYFKNVLEEVKQEKVPGPKEPAASEEVPIQSKQASNNNLIEKNKNILLNLNKSRGGIVKKEKKTVKILPEVKQLPKDIKPKFATRVESKDRRYCTQFLKLDESKNSTPIQTHNRSPIMRHTLKSFMQQEECENSVDVAQIKHDRIVEQHNTVLEFLQKFIPKQFSSVDLPLKEKVSKFIKDSLDPATITVLNIKVTLLIHLLLDENRRTLVEQFCMDENIIGVIHDFQTLYSPKLKNIRTFLDEERNKDLHKENEDNLIFAIMNCLENGSGENQQIKNNS